MATASVSAPPSRTFTRLSFLLLMIAYIAFICLGLTDTLRDKAFPYIRATFEQPLEATGILLFPGTIGYMLISFTSGQIITRFGTGRTLALSCALRAVALFSFAYAPSWEMLLIASFFSGVGGGLLDSSTNIYVAANYGATPMFWLHAAFGIGATMGPLLMTWLIDGMSQTWRIGYAIGAGTQIALLVIFALTLERWNRISHSAPVTEAGQGTDLNDAVNAPVPNATQIRTPILSTLRLPAVWLSILIFVLYTGTEVAAPLWGYSLFTESRGIAPDTAGIWVSIYWGTFTLGRIAAGFITRWLNDTLYMRLSMAMAVVGAVLLWWSPVPVVGLIGLAGMAFALAPLFPALISSTEKRVSVEHAANTIGFQIAAAGLGVAILPSVAGVLAKQLTLEIVPVTLIVVCVAMLILHEIILRGVRPVRASI